MTRYVQNHGILSGGRYLLGYPGFDACSQIDFESVAAVEEGFASGFYRESVTWDERAFVDKSRFSLVVGQPLVVRAGEERGVKLLSFLRLHPGS
ncbi:MAG: hypothetical protein KatS3mg011_2286 [Acidimicrobiia bacterium]|nr:MAG: hypothetical protein KatS3mg011_2286 [Acidimicrobiia bacterium]